jgi:hypothetical protein
MKSEKRIGREKSFLPGQPNIGARACASRTGRDISPKACVSNFSAYVEQRADGAAGTIQMNNRLVDFLFPDQIIERDIIIKLDELSRKMWRKLLIANITEAISKNHEATASSPSIEQVQAFLTAASNAPQSERVLNNGIRLATRDGDSSLYAEIKRSDGRWVHRNYLAKQFR